jgi:hypothetical protein
MKKIQLSVLAISILLVLNGSVSPLFADGNREVYIMNPDGLPELKLSTFAQEHKNAPYQGK